MVVRCRQRLLITLECAMHSKGVFAELLVFLKHPTQVVLEVSYLHLAGV